MKKYVYPVCVYPGDVSGFTVIVPDLPGQVYTFVFRKGA